VLATPIVVENLIPQAARGDDVVDHLARRALAARGVGDPVGRFTHLGVAVGDGDGDADLLEQRQVDEVVCNVGDLVVCDALEALGTDCAAAICTPQETAAYNIKSWAQSGSSFGGTGGIQDRLPAASARIQRIGADFPVMLEVSVTWNEQKSTSGLDMASTYYTGTGSAANAQRDFTYTVRARP